MGPIKKNQDREEKRVAESAEKKCTLVQKYLFMGEGKLTQRKIKVKMPCQIRESEAWSPGN